jgi:hypothetical protein
MKRSGHSQAVTSGGRASAAQRKIIIYIATSADGYIARPDGSVDWLNRPMPRGGYSMTTFAHSIDTILWGRHEQPSLSKGCLVGPTKNDSRVAR